MSDGTHIEWTDATWNIITGCSVVSPGCKHCYAMKLAGTRLKHDPSRAGLTMDTAAGPVWNGEVRFNEKWLDQPLRWKRPRKIFVCAHGDLFHESVPDEWLDKVFAVMALAPQHTFQVLTKRADRMHRYVTDQSQTRRDGRGTAVLSINPNQPLESLDWPLPNVWMGVSVEDQTRAEERIPFLLRTPAAVRWLSAEPLLGPLDLERVYGIRHNAPFSVLTDADEYGRKRCTMHARGYCLGGCEWRLPPVGWVVLGGESGAGARPMNPQWARDVRDQCARAGVPFLFKQWGEYASVSEVEGAGAHHTFPDGRTVRKLGKKAAGRRLDGQTHDGYPVL